MTLQKIIHSVDVLSIEERKSLLNHVIESLGSEAWSVANGSAEMFLAAIREAIAQDAPEIAFALAERGYQLHPGSTQLKEAVRMLAT